MDVAKGGIRQFSRIRNHRQVAKLRTFMVSQDPMGSDLDASRHGKPIELLSNKNTHSRASLR